MRSAAWVLLGITGVAGVPGLALAGRALRWRGVAELLNRQASLEQRVPGGPSSGGPTEREGS